MGANLLQAKHGQDDHGHSTLQNAMESISIEAMSDGKHPQPLQEAPVNYMLIMRRQDNPARASAYKVPKGEICMCTAYDNAFHASFCGMGQFRSRFTHQDSFISNFPSNRKWPIIQHLVKDKKDSYILFSQCDNCQPKVQQFTLNTQKDNHVSLISHNKFCF